MTTILGINAYHGDASASLLVDGQLVAAVEEERFNRIKHWAGFPAESIRYCMEEGGVKAQDLDHVAISFNPRANMGKRVAEAVGCESSGAECLAAIEKVGLPAVLLEGDALPAEIFVLADTRTYFS